MFKTTITTLTSLLFINANGVPPMTIKHTGGKLTDPTGALWRIPTGRYFVDPSPIRVEISATSNQTHLIINLSYKNISSTDKGWWHIGQDYCWSNGWILMHAGTNMPIKWKADSGPNDYYITEAPVGSDKHLKIDPNTAGKVVIGIDLNRFELMDGQHEYELIYYRNQSPKESWKTTHPGIPVYSITKSSPFIVKLEKAKTL